MPDNPYTHRGPVTGEDFYGREKEFARLLQLLGTRPPQSVAVYGPERIGKSSLLRELCEARGPARLPHLTFVYVDAQGAYDRAAFFRAATGKAAEDYRSFDDWLDEQPQPVVLCLDEFGKALANEDFEDDFFDFLRSKANSGRLALVTSTLTPLSELKVPSGAEVSRFFNIFTPLPLGPLAEPEARQLAAEPAARAGQPFAANEVERALALSERRPFHLQVFCEVLFEAKRAGDGRALPAAEAEYRRQLETARSPHGARPPGAEAAPTAQPARPAPRFDWEAAAGLMLFLASVSAVIWALSLNLLFAWGMFIFTGLGLGLLTFYRLLRR